jgi:hypothetical protein
LARMPRTRMHFRFALRQSKPPQNGNGKMKGDTQNESRDNRVMSL